MLRAVPVPRAMTLLRRTVNSCPLFPARGLGYSRCDTGAACIPQTATEPERPMADTIISRCEAKGLRITGQRRTIAQVLQQSEDHPDVEELYARASARDAGISIATVYRTVKLFEEAGILDKLEFGDGRARYEDAEREHHDHLIDMNSGEVIEFVDPDIEELQELIARKLGYQLKGHKLELYGVPLKSRKPSPSKDGA
jgi:Fur family ferric uptake transcriptional regulator